MSKPDWKDAPEWANFLAQDEGGEWYWYEHEPQRLHTRFDIDYSVEGREESRATRAKIVKYWFETLERRP